MTARRSLAPHLVGSRPSGPYHFSARNQSFQTIAAPFPGWPTPFGRCGRAPSPATGFVRSRREAPGANGRRRNASGQTPPSRTKASPSRTKKTGLDLLGLFRPIRGFSMGYEQFKSKNSSPHASLPGRRYPLRSIARGGRLRDGFDESDNRRFRLARRHKNRNRTIAQAWQEKMLIPL